MNNQQVFQALNDHAREVFTLGQIAQRLGWDQEVVMPRGASEQRAEETGVLEAVIHRKKSDPRIAEWLGTIDVNALEEKERAIVREMARDHRRATRTPEALSREIATVTSRAQGIWAAARAAGDFADFKPTLKQVLKLRQEEARALSDGGDLYDALLDDYEPGMTAAELQTMLGQLRVGLVELRGRIATAEAPVDDLEGQFSDRQQMLIARELATAFGYDWGRGRLDKAVHPFASGSFNDVRITTRVVESDPFNCLYSTIHEVGHATYEQGINQDYGLTPIGAGASMGVHESQSRIVENQIGRSQSFATFLFTKMQAEFGYFGIDTAEDFYRTINKMRAGFIRTEADEVQYNLHVMLRFDLERAMIAGDLLVDDLEAAWNDRFEADFGYPVDTAANGVLQDVHWAVGLIGYFPTYTLGNIYAGELYQKMRGALSSLDQDLAAGDTSGAMTWLRENIHQHGKLFEPAELITHAIGHRPSHAPLMSYLNQKFEAIYQL